MFSEKLNEIKEKKHINNKEIAEKLNLSNSAITNWTKGAYPNSEVLKRFCEKYHVSADWMLEIDSKNWEKDSDSGHAIESITLSPEERLLIEYYRKIDAFDQKTILQLAQREVERQENRKQQKKSSTSEEKVS